MILMSKIENHDATMLAHTYALCEESVSRSGAYVRVVKESSLTTSWEDYAIDKIFK